MRTREEIRDSYMEDRNTVNDTDWVAVEGMNQILECLLDIRELLLDEKKARESKDMPGSVC